MKTAIMIAVICAAILLPTCATADAEPDRVLFYYGWPSSFNYQTNWWSPSLVAQDMSQYDMVVLGAGLEATSHPDHANTINIISQTSADVHGYVTLNQAENVIRAKIARWNAMGADGIFIDEAGYDFGAGRAKFNRVMDHIHRQSGANTAFVNAWNPDHVMGTANDASYPNSAYNPGNVASHIKSGDYYLLESCPVYHNTYLMSNHDVRAKCKKCTTLRNVYGVNLASVSTIGNTCPTGQTLYNRHMVIANAYAFDVQGTSDIWYGAGSSQVKMW